MEEDHRSMEEGGLKDRGVTREVSSSDLDEVANKHRMVIGVRLPRRPKRPKKKRSSKDKSSERTPLTSNDFSATSNTCNPHPIFHTAERSFYQSIARNPPAFCQNPHLADASL